MIADPKESESKTKTIAGQLPNRLPMRRSALGATSGSCTEARCSISSPNHEIAITQTWAASRSKADDLPPRSIHARPLKKRSPTNNKADRGQPVVWLHSTHAVHCEDDRPTCCRRVGSWHKATVRGAASIRFASGGEAHMPRPRAAYRSDANDPQRTSEMHSNSRGCAGATAMLATEGEADHKNCCGVIASPHGCTNQGAMLQPFVIHATISSSKSATSRGCVMYGRWEVASSRERHPGVCRAASASRSYTAFCHCTQRM
jgi:hypothetical protein